MDKIIVYRKNHKELLDREINESYKIYTDNYNKIIKDLEYLNDILKDIQGKITLEPHKDSWYEYIITIEYLNHIFSIGPDYKNKLNVYLPELYKYHGSTYYNTIIETYKKENKPLNYSFDKLTTKKLLEVLNYYISLLDITKKESLNKENTNQALYNEVKTKIDYIANILKIKPQEYIDNNDKEYWIRTFFDKIYVNYNLYSKQTTYYYNIDQFITMIKNIKQEI